MKNPLYRFNHRVKSSLKRSLFPGSTLFEDMGFTYLGPVDGHDLPRLCDTLNWARELDCPVVVHVNTVKGRGCAFAERNPDMYHGVGSFDPETGLLKTAGGDSFSSVFGKALADFAREDDRVCAVTAAMADGTGLSGFAKTFPDRFFDVGIAEGHGVSMAAGMAAQGLLPVFAVYSTFLQRGYDMLIHDVALEKLHGVLGVDRAGLVGADGETHHGCFDALFLPALPGYTVLCPASFAELRHMLKTALFSLSGPVAVRYPRGGEGAYQNDASDRPLVRLRAGRNQYAACWVALEKRLRQGKAEEDRLPYLRRLAGRMGGSESFLRAVLALEVFRERGLISLSEQGDRLTLCLIPLQGKVDLTACPYLLRLQEKEAT